MRIKVWLIHGTWARQAPWTRDGSPLRKALQDGLKADVSFEVFPWTGRNNTIHRFKAAAELLSRLKANSDGPDMNFVIAHSHGGNIAADALASDRVEIHSEVDEPPLLDGVITLNTPFLTAILRDPGLLKIHLIMLALCVLFLIPRLLPFSWFIETLISGALLVLLSLTGLINFMFWVSELHNVPKMASIMPRSKILAIGAPDDEAFSWLEAVDSFLNVPYLLLHKGALPLTLLGIALIHYISRWDLYYVDWFARAVVAAREKGSFSSAFWKFLFDSAFRSPPPLTDDMIHGLSGWFYENAPPPLLITMFIFSVIGHFLTFWAIFAITAWVMTYFFRAIAFGEGFGPNAFARAFASRLKVSMTPLGHSDVELAIVPSKSSAWLRHSNVYANPAALEYIVKWMNERVELRCKSKN